MTAESITERLGRALYNHGKDERDPTRLPSRALRAIGKRRAGLDKMETALNMKAQQLKKLEKRLLKWQMELQERKPRLEQQDLPFLLVIPKNSKRAVPSLFVDPANHEAFTPAIKVDVKSKDLINRDIRLVFRVFRASDRKIWELEAEHKLKKGTNVIAPNQFLKAGGLQRDDYAVAISVAPNFILNKLVFHLGEPEESAKMGTDASVEGFNRISNDGLSFQDAIDLIRSTYDKRTK